MPKFVLYLYENFKIEMQLSGSWPKGVSSEEMVCLFEWYSTKLRPFMWEFYGIMTATCQAGLTNGLFPDDKSFDSDQEGQPGPQELEGNNRNRHQLQKIHDEYITRFKFICEQMEAKFFKLGPNPHAQSS